MSELVDRLASKALEDACDSGYIAPGWSTGRPDGAARFFSQAIRAALREAAKVPHAMADAARRADGATAVALALADAAARIAALAD
jgi:hypothetical protein